MTFTYDGLPEGEVPTFANTYTAPKGDGGDGSADGSGQGGKAMPQTGDATTGVAVAVAAGVALVAAGAAQLRKRQ